MILIPTEYEHFTNYYGFYYKDTEAKNKHHVSHMKYIYNIERFSLMYGEENEAIIDKDDLMSIDF